MEIDNLSIKSLPNIFAEGQMISEHFLDTWVELETEFCKMNEKSMAVPREQFSMLWFQSF